jgi:hypothetical protein
MAADGCAEQVPQDQLPGSPFFQDFSSSLATNPAQKNYGISVTDIDGDGAFEFVVAGFGAANQAFKWDPSEAKFKDVALGNSVLQDTAGMAIGLAACDVDADGFEELYILNTDSYSAKTQTSDKLLDRDTSGAYTDILGGANYVAGRSCACVDRFGHGRYSVFVANYGGPMRLYEVPEDETTVVDMATIAGVDKITGGRALIAGPLITNRMDVFANNEGYSGRLLSDRSVNHSRRLSHRKNFFFANDGDGKFTDVATDVGLLDASQTGRGTTIIDSNGDGLLDIVYGNWNGPHRLYVQEIGPDNCPKFVDKAPVSMVVPSRIRTVIVADFDNDGYEEIFWNNIPGANRLFRKLPTDEDWIQVQIGDALEENGYGTGAAVGDFDGDGQLELIIAHGESASQPLSYFRPRQGVGNHWLRILPLTSHGAPARGAKVSIRAGGRTQVRVIDAGSGYLCQMEPVAHFGLGTFTAVDTVTVTWPDGAAHSVTSPGIDQLLRIARPSSLVPPAFRGHCAAPLAPMATPTPTSTPMQTPTPAPMAASMPTSPPTLASTPTPTPMPTPTQAPAASQVLTPVPTPGLEPISTPAPTPTKVSTLSNKSASTSTAPSALISTMTQASISVKSTVPCAGLAWAAYVFLVSLSVL